MVQPVKTLMVFLSASYISSGSVQKSFSVFTLCLSSSCDISSVPISHIWSCRPLPDVVFQDAIKDNPYSPNKFHIGLSAKVCIHLHQLYLRRLNNRIPPRQIADKMTREDRNTRHKIDGDKLKEGKANFGHSHGMGINTP
ncbi:hypothetical protein POM88_034120 [Heracleum sosnowskyi]|uniref:DCD domain-containing protein n=1 Tax=Heracleum sosnowskyi TaxID=360622 RepID=A0AAD8MDA7_9APIA|nr:hypothetical protein POM88_034120 [Heracleum sosnowskyi]